MYCFWIFSNKLDLNPETSFYYIIGYEKVRKKYFAEGAFPHLYDKVKPEVDVVKIGQVEKPLNFFSVTK